MFAKLATFLFLQLIFADFSAEAISCYQCSSVNNSQCENLEMWARGRFIMPKPCDDFNNTIQPFCRKTVLQLLENTKVTSRRVIRSCGYIKHKNKDCYRTDNDDHLETVCHCFQDNCNSSSSIRPHAIIIFLSMMFMFKIVIF